MVLPPNLYKKYLDRFDELIQEGELIEKTTLQSGLEFMSLPYRQYLEWKIKCISLFDQVLPAKSTQRSLIEELKEIEPSMKASHVYQNAFQRCLSYLKAIKSDFEAGFLQDLSLQIEAELAADYMGQAEQLLAEGQSGQYDHIPAGVLAGAVLEKGLRTLCSKQTPPLPLVDGKGNSLMMNRLIDDLRKVSAFNELKAKQLRAWAAIRNKAAHGEFDQFSRNDVETMIGGINTFLADYLQ